MTRTIWKTLTKFGLRLRDGVGGHEGRKSLLPRRNMPLSFEAVPMTLMMTWSASHVKGSGSGSSTVPGPSPNDDVKSLTSKVDRPASKEPTKAHTKPQSCKTKKLAMRSPALGNKIEWARPVYVDPPGRRTSIRRCNGERRHRPATITARSSTASPDCNVSPAHRSESSGPHGPK